MPRFRVLVAGFCLAVLAWAGPAQPRPVAGATPDDAVVAYLDGRRIPIEDISRYFCDDFSYPTIRCSTLAVTIEARAVLVAFVTGTDYVTIYDQTSYAGPFMHVSQDYGTLMSIGWNDRVSSFKGRNGETGRFWTDWFNTGSSWNFCCNSTVPSLGGYNNTFSAIERT